MLGGSLSTDGVLYFPGLNGTMVILHSSEYSANPLLGESYLESNLFS
jgi:hypothetical protein